MINILDLEAHRCPSAMSLARRAIKDYHSSAKSGDKLAIQTIEPSFTRDLAMFLNSSFPTIEIEEVISGRISNKSKEEWKDDFEASDWRDCTQSCFILKTI